MSNRKLTHLEFVDELQKLGVRISSSNRKGEIKKFCVYEFNKSNFVIARDFQLSWESSNNYETPLAALLRKAVDMDSWKHSWHIKMDAENYERIESIIQQKILDRAKEINELMFIYFQLHYEMVKIAKKED